jgi:threonine synthase
MHAIQRRRIKRGGGNRPDETPATNRTVRAARCQVRPLEPFQGGDAPYGLTRSAAQLDAPLATCLPYLIGCHGAERDVGWGPVGRVVSGPAGASRQASARQEAEMTQAKTSTPAGDPTTDPSLQGITLRCRGCGATYQPALTYACGSCLGPLDVHAERDVVAGALTRAAVEAGPASIWRWAPLLPARPGDGDLAPGLTPLRPAPRLAEALGVPGPLYLKDDTRNPTNSFKDRVVSVALARARAFGITTVACASTGNLAGATAAAAAAQGLDCVVVIPSDLEPAKIASAAAFGATVVAVDGSYDHANRLSAQAAEAFGWGFVNVNLRPWYAEGSKTVGLEVAEQLGWALPDHVIVPIASGALLTKVHQGLRTLVEFGLVEPRPFSVHGAQSDGCAPVANAFAENRDDVTPVRPSGIVKSLAIGDPADGVEALEVVRSTGGRCEAVTDAEVVDAIELLARTTGIFGETAAGATVATLGRLARAGAFNAGEVVVALITGHGLKTREVLDGRAGATVTVRPNVDALEEALGKARPELIEGS